MPDRGYDFVDLMGIDPATGRSVTHHVLDPNDASSPSGLPKDWYFIEDFSETHLIGGDGLPGNPNSAYTRNRSYTIQSFKWGRHNWTNG